PFELGILGKLVAFDKGDFVGRRALESEQAAGGPPRRLVGLEIEWAGLERLYFAQALPPVMTATTSRVHVPLFAGRKQVGRVSSTTWSPNLKQAIALASASAEHSTAGTSLEVEWTVEARRGRASAKVVELPFLNPPRKTVIVPS